MDRNRKKFLIITASILLHLMGMFVIFVLYHQPSHDLFADFDPSKAIDIPETYFYDPSPSSSTDAPGVQPPDDESWGQFKPRAGTLGASMEMPDGPIGIEMPGKNSENDAADGQQDEESSETSDESGQESDGGKNSLEFSAQVSYENTESIVTSSQEKPNNSNTPFHPEEHASASRRTKKSAARKALAGITRGYLQQLQDEGENLIKTLGGDPNKKPTAEQLKYERYLAKIQWCLQNAHNINQEKCMPQEPIESAMKIYFVLNRDGKMTGFKILQSSGKAYVDQYISSLFQFASSSFPPLPAYIKEEYFPLTYTVIVNWNSGSHMGFSRY